MFTVANLLEHLSEGDSIEQRKLEKILKLTKKNERQKLEIAVQALLKLGILETEVSGTLKKSSNNSFIEARLRCSSKGYCFAIRDDGAGEDIYIRDNHLNHAWNGDRVLVKISREAIRRRSPEGIVQCILERTTTNILSLLEKEDENLIATPLDDRILSSILLKNTEHKFYDQAKEENLVEVHIDRFPIGQYDAQGHVVRALPLDAGTNGDIDILLTKNNLNSNKLSPRSTIKNPSEKNRVDLKDQQTLILKSWSEPNSPPLPAIHVEPKEGGTRLWVHSPTIAERVSIGNNLDNWLFKRAESHCLGNKWNTLLNESLMQASQFKVDEINKAITAQIDISPEGKILDWEFFLSEIKPVAEIEPKHLISLDARKPKSRAIPVALKPIKDYLVQLQTIIFCSNQLQELEKKNGLLELDLPVPKLDDLSELIWELPGTEFEQWKLPLSKTDPNSILSPLIRAANRAWCQHIKELNIPGIVIKAESIDSDTLNDVAKSALSLDLQLELNDQGIPSASDLSSAFSKASSRRVLEKALRYALPTPKLSSYKTKSNLIADPINDIANDNFDNTQAPWCCPSLHYADIINQHIQISLLRDGKSRPSARHKTNIELGKKGCQTEINWTIFSESIISSLINITSEKVVDALNTQHRKAKLLRSSLISMTQARAAEPFIGKEVDAVISGVQSYGFFAEIKPSMAEGLVHVSSLSDDWYEYRSRQNKLVGRKSKKAYQLGDPIKIKILKVDILRNQIDLELIPEKNVPQQKESDSSNTTQTDFQPIPITIIDT